MHELGQQQPGQSAPADAGEAKPTCDLGESDHPCPRCGDDFISWACELVCWNCGLKFTCDE